MGAQQAPEVEALRQFFLFIQPVELIDGFAVSHMPVQVTVPVDGDAYHPTLPGTQALKIRGLGSRTPALQLVQLFSVCLRRDTEKLLQG